MTEDRVKRGPWPANEPTGGLDQNRPTGGGGVDGGGPSSQLSAMDVRLARLEGTVDMFKLLLSLIMAVMLAGFAFLGVQLTRLEAKATAIASDVQSLPGKISGNLANLTRTLADAITAAKQSPTQVILLPPPTRNEQPSGRPEAK